MIRATGNQRVASRKQLKQQHLLDVNVRSRKASQQRNRRIVTWCCAMILLAGMSCVAWYGAREGLRRFFWENPDYNLAEIEIKTDGPLGREQVIEATHLREGVNLFSVDLAKTREALLALPQVERAEVERVLPGKIAIDLAERKPVAWIAMKFDEDPSQNPKSFLIDRKGVLLKTRELVGEYFHLPIIYGVPVENFRAGEIVETAEVRAALDLIRLSSDNPARLQVSAIDLSKGYCMIVKDQRHARITFGLEDIDLQLQRFGVLLDRIEKSQRELQTVNLLVQRNVPVTFAPPADGTALSDEAPLPAKPVVKPVSTPLPIVLRPGTTPKLPVIRRATTPAKSKPVRKAIPVHRSSTRNG